MTTATRSVAVVATSLPDIDRRALSQAWYSALHLSQASAQTPARRPDPPRLAPRVQAARAAVPEHAQSATRFVPTRPNPAGPAPAFALERRGAASDLSRRIVRAIARSGALRPQHMAATAVNVGDGRVQLLVRSDGETTRIVALCAPHLRERVDRALAHARFSLAAAGGRPEIDR